MVRRIKGLDGLRALAVLMVIMSHAMLWPQLGVENEKVIMIFGPNVGVNIFFALSGFLITHLLVREKQETGKVNIFDFFMRRTIRIFPLYFLAVFVIVAADVLGKAKIQSCVYVNAFTYTLNFVSKECNFSSFSHFWSLAVEEHFYLIWPFVFLAGRRWALLFAIVFSFLGLVFSVKLYPPNPDYYLENWTFPAALPIAFGCIAAFVADSALVKRFLAETRVSAILLVAILAGLSSPAFMNSQFFWLVSISLLLLYIYHGQETALVKFLEIKPLVVLGIISYGLYVWQGVFTGNGPYRESGATFPPDVNFGVWLTFLIAPLSYLFFERPLLRLKGKFSWHGSKK